MRRTIKYLIIGVGVIAVLVGVVLVKKIFFPSPYTGVYWYKLAGRAIYFGKYSFAKYNLPPDYKLVTYREDERFRHGLLLFENKVTGQLFVLFVLKGFSRIDFEQIKADPQEPRMPFWKAARHPLSREKHSFSLWHYLPFGWRDDYENSGNDLTLKGVRVAREEEFDSNVAKVKWMEGNFEKLEFKKQSDNWRPFVSSVLDFAKPMYGAIAVLNENETGLTTFAIGSNTNKGNFNEKEFRDIVQSITFDAIPSEKVEEEFGRELKRLKEAIKDTRELEKALQEYLDNY